MSSEPLKLAFVGGAVDSAVGEVHSIAAQMDNRWRLVAGCFSTDEAINRQTAEQRGIDRGRTYADSASLFDSEKGSIDAVAILTPTPEHAGMVIAALDHGYPVICEKALAVSSAQALDIKDAAERNCAFLAVTYNYTGYAMVRELRELIQEGRLGRIRQVHIEMPQESFIKLNPGGEPAVPQAWRLDDAQVPTLSLDLGVHVHNLVGFLTGERPVAVVAKNNTFGSHKRVVDNTLCIASYSNGIDCQMWFSKSAMGHSNGLRVRVYGERGAAQWYQMRPDVIKLSDDRGERYTVGRSSAGLRVAGDARYNRFKAGHPTGFIEAFANHYVDLAGGLRQFRETGSSSSPWLFGVDDAISGLVFFEAVARSATQQSWEKISDN